MIVDKQTEFSNAQAITASAASSNQYDNGPTSDRGNAHGNRQPDMVFIVEESFAGPNGSTLELQLRTSTVASMANPVVVARSPALALADLVVGKKVPWAPAFPKRTKRYTDVYYVVTGGPMTAGKITVTTAMTDQEPVGSQA